MYECELWYIIWGKDTYIYQAFENIILRKIYETKGAKVCEK
jgi:hypothetical protein